MQSIPMPQLLDAEQELLTCHDLESAQDAARRIADYGRQLWDELLVVREYLADSTASGAARPSNPGDDEGWDRWTAVSAGVGRVLSGPRGDSGFAADEARAEARRRRDPEAPGLPAERGGETPTAQRER